MQLRIARARGRFLTVAKKKVRGKDVKRLRKQLGLDMAGMASRLGVDVSTVWRWEARPEHPVSGPVSLAIEALRASQQDVA